MAKRWYSVSVLSNFEKKVAGQIMEAVRQEELESEIEEVLVPTEMVADMFRGKRREKERLLMPGYILVRMEMSDKCYHLISSVNRVSGFLGPRGNPQAMPDDQVDDIISRVREGTKTARSLITMEIGESVRVTDGPLEGFSGIVEEVDEASQRLKVNVSIFGRATPVELEYAQVNKQG